MTDQETEVVMEGGDHDQDQGQGVLTGVAETLAAGGNDSEEETGKDSSVSLFIQLLIITCLCTSTYIVQLKL